MCFFGTGILEIKYGFSNHKVFTYLHLFDIHNISNLYFYFFLSILINVLELLVIDGIHFHQSFLRDLGFNLFVLLISVKVVHNLYEARKFLKHLQCTRMCTQFPKFKGG